MRKSLNLEIERGGVLTFAESEGSMVILNAIQLLWQNGELAFLYKHNIYSVFIAIKSLSREKIIIIQLLDSTKEQHWTILLSIPKRKEKGQQSWLESMKSYNLVHLIFCHAIFFCCCSWLNTLVRVRHTRFAWGYYYCCWMWREQEPVEILSFCIHKYIKSRFDLLTP